MSEKLPGICRKVDVWHKTRGRLCNVHMSFVSHKRGQKYRVLWTTGDGRDSEGITHWMHIPGPPVGDGEVLAGLKV